MQHLSRLQRSAHNTVNGFNPHGNCPQRQTHGTRYIITVIPVLNVNAGDDCIHAAAALIMLCHCEFRYGQVDLLCVEGTGRKNSRIYGDTPD